MISSYCYILTLADHANYLVRFLLTMQVLLAITMLADLFLAQRSELDLAISTHMYLPTMETVVA